MLMKLRFKLAALTQIEQENSDCIKLPISYQSQRMKSQNTLQVPHTIIFSYCQKYG